VVLVLTTRQHNIGSLTWNMQYFLSMTYTFIKNERRKYTLHYTVLIHKYGNQRSIYLNWKIRIFFFVSHSAHLLKFEANAYLIIPQWKFLFPSSDSPQMTGRCLSLVPHVLERETRGFPDSSILTNYYINSFPSLSALCLQQTKILSMNCLITFEGCVTVYLFRESKWIIPIWCNNCDLLMFLGSTCFRHLRPSSGALDLD
jgi:hypothetical protein